MLGGIAVALNAWLPTSAFFHCISVTSPTAILVDHERQDLLGEEGAGKLRSQGTKAVFVVRTKEAKRGFERLDEALERHEVKALPKIEIKDEVSALVSSSSFHSLRQLPPHFSLKYRNKRALTRYNALPAGPRHHLLHLRHDQSSQRRPLDAASIPLEQVEHGRRSCARFPPEGREHPGAGSERAAEVVVVDCAAVPCHGCAELLSLRRISWSGVLTEKRCDPQATSPSSRSSRPSAAKSS